MTRAQRLTFGLWLLLFWGAAALLWAPAMERALTHSAAEAVRGLETGYGAPEIHFEGQTAVLKGKVRLAAQRAALAAMVKQSTQARTPLAAGLGGGFRGVAAVENHLAVTPYEPGWLMLAVSGKKARLVGVVASEFEARDLTEQIQQAWDSARGYVEPQLTVRASGHDEAPQPQQTLNTLPLPKPEAGGDSAQIHVARLGETWRRLVTDAKDELLQDQAARLGISAADWNELMLPAVASVRAYQEHQRTQSAEAERQRKLPPPYFFLAARDRRILLRGELPSLGIKHQLLNEVIVAFPGWRVVEDLRVNADRRRVDDFAAITTALLPSALDSETSCVLGIPGQAWSFLDSQISAPEQPWKDILPPGLAAQDPQADLAIVQGWLHHSGEGIPSLPLTAQPSFVTMVLLPGKVILAGQLAEEPLRTRLIQAARDTYGNKVMILDDDFLARGTCEPSENVEQTARSFPPLPGPEEPPRVAFAIPGEVWKSSVVSPRFLEPGGLGELRLLPEGFPAAMAEDTFAEAAPHLRRFWETPRKADGKKRAD